MDKLLSDFRCLTGKLHVLMTRKRRRRLKHFTLRLVHSTSTSSSSTNRTSTQINKDKKQVVAEGLLGVSVALALSP